MATYTGTQNHRRYFSGEKPVHTPTFQTFEFTEFDVWNVGSSPELHKTLSSSRKLKKPVPMENRALSVPVDVPDWSMILKEKRKAGNANGDDFDEDLYGGDELIPPHEYLARGRMASFSVQEGVGRTLKGRDLSTVRDAVWKKIGFED
ncbi:protein S40-4-like [Bidens hawaiensis]|uniref:protein S40-4-like n=1 Tax=Bidens hawaiensis TaxID=980011 RepID=UPI00404ADEEF